jgi:ABC-2 type transport system ATP-binding protein
MTPQANMRSTDAGAPSSAPGTAISATGVTKAYRSVPAVESLSLEVAAGTVLGFLGPNGAGKTTAIRILSTMLAPDSGTFTIAGVPHTQALEIRRRTGVLPESAGYPSAQTALEWLSYHGRLFGASSGVARDRAVQLLSEVGLAERGRSRIAGFSRGMRQRLGIARALIHHPEVVFLDEPTLGLDPAGQHQVLDIVANLAREHGVTVVLSTHALAEVEQLCNRVVIINRGCVVADGTVAEIVHRSAVPLRGSVLVPPEMREHAIEVLAAQRVAAHATLHDHPDEIEFALPSDASTEQASTMVLRCLLDVGVPVLGFAIERGRLTDAFAALTTEERRG